MKPCWLCPLDTGGQSRATPTSWNGTASGRVCRPPARIAASGPVPAAVLRLCPAAGNRGIVTLRYGSPASRARLWDDSPVQALSAWQLSGPPGLRDCEWLAMTGSLRNPSEHPKKEIRDVLSLLAKGGWTVRKAGHWGTACCPCRPPCTRIAVGGTPRNAGRAARRILNEARRCPLPPDDPRRSVGV